MCTKTLLYPFALLTTIALCFTLGVNAQLQANFTVDKIGGCSPLSVQFTNTTTGGSASTTYQWTFGNGNSSTKKDPGASYYDEKTYTVTLTAKDGATTNVKTQQVTVYKKPVVDFGVSPAKGCVPLATTFTANATAGDGTIAKYYWDFGDGGTEQGTSQTTSHTYTFPQKPPTSLTVTNSYGCYTTSTKNGLVDAVKSVTASVMASTSALCNPGDEVTFISSATGSGTLTYAWDFGDGKTASEQSPKHIFATKGTFTAKLKVSSSDGCSADATPVTINVANFVADFDVPALICQNQQANFTNKSTQGYDKVEWWVDNDYVYYYYNYTTLPYTYYTTGEHTVKLIATYGTCNMPVTKKVTINPTPQMNGFIADLQGACGVPLTINFKDTTKDVIKWDWKLNSGSSFATTQSTSHTFESGTVEWVNLTTTNKEGCSSNISQLIYYAPPNIDIYIKNYNGYGASDCIGQTKQFAATPDTLIKDYSWSFGDGATSTEKEPSHTFNKAGSFRVTLNYTTKSGCKGTTTYYNYINVIDKPKFDFAVVGSTTICGNTPTTLNANPAPSDWAFNWSFNGGYFNYTGNFWASSINLKFEYDTTYSVQMIASYGNCADTVYKKDYLKVLPPFPKVGTVSNTCDDTRGTVRFTETSYKALSWSWDFGDGGTESYTSFKDTIRHTYTKTGAYNVVLSTTNGPCTVKDSIPAYVLLKQKPILTATKTDACGSDVVPFKLAGMEINPAPYYYYYNDFYISRTEFNDLTTGPNNINIPNSYWRQEIEGNISRLVSGKNDLRFITTSSYFNCQDTSNFIPIKVHGPTADFLVQPYSGCFKESIFFKDDSHVYSNRAIVKWQWDFGDGTSQTLTSAGSTSHLYRAPGYYYILLTVTDVDGCTSTSEYNITNHNIQLDGPQADFYATAYDVAPNTVVYFNNSSQYYYGYNVELKWIFPDGSTSTEDYPSFNFAEEGLFPVKLITRNLITGCPDTATKNVRVRKVNSVFTYTLSYINNNSCPPVMARFTSISSNYVRLGWDFGDGGVGGDQQIVSHTYNAAGLYRVVHYSYDANNAVDSTEDFIEIKGPYALMKADTLYACNTLEVKLSAEVKYAKDYTWDFGDGTLVAGTDTFATHNYLTPGIYIPALILKDDGGCTTTSQLPDKIIVDSLSAEFSTVPAAVCNAATVVFTPQTNSLSADNLQTVLQYRWVIKEGTASDTLYDQFASRNFSLIGVHNIGLQVTSPYGCVANAVGTVDVKPGVSASIVGPAQVCRNEAVTFTGKAIPASNTLQWTWNFGSSTSNLQNPAAQVFTTAGQQMISLIVSNGNCSDTANFTLSVQDAPVITISPAQPILCLGDSMKLTATGGATYQWTPAALIQNANAATATVWPAANKFYKVKATNAAGCASQDSVEVKVIAPLQLTAKSPLFACAGNTVQLNATGADKYAWQNSTGLSNANIANPIATTATATTYTVVGYDSYNCFTDTAIVAVKIGKLPTVNAGTDYQIIAGSQVKLTTTNSADVNKWEWNPADYLNCATCPSPISTPKASTTYEVTVYTSEGCFAKDTVRIELICKSELVYIPTGFTPNGDNLNDRFAIHGSGIKSIRHLVVFDRWGKAVFERKNANINDRNSSWDGKYNNEPAPSAAYIYMVEVECDGGDVFTYKGTVTLIR